MNCSIKIIDNQMILIAILKLISAEGIFINSSKWWPKTGNKNSKNTQNRFENKIMKKTIVT